MMCNLIAVGINVAIKQGMQKEILYRGFMEKFCNAFQTLVIKLWPGECEPEAFSYAPFFTNGQIGSLPS